MMNDAAPWLLIEASSEGVMRYATAIPSDKPRLTNIGQINISGLPTFTDALQTIERELKMPLRGVQCAMAMAGATSGEALSLVRSRWTITRAGLAAVFDREVTVINDVAARAWATRASSASIDALRGVGQPSLSRPGRMMMLMVDEGVGASAIDVDREGGIRILETELGHIDFAPDNEREERLAKAMRAGQRHVSWEQILMVNRTDPIWQTALPEMGESERGRFVASLLGRFTVNAMTAFGAWQGVMLTGGRISRIIDASSRASFDAAMGERRNFSRLLIAAPVWRVEQRDAVLAGAAERLANSLRPGA